MAQKQKKFNPRAELVSFMESKVDPQLNFNINDILRRAEQRAAALDARGVYHGSPYGSETLVETISDYMHSKGKSRISQLTESEVRALRSRCDVTIGIIDSRRRKAPKAQPKPTGAKQAARTTTTTTGFGQESRTRVTPKRRIDSAAVTPGKKTTARDPLALQRAMAASVSEEIKKRTPAKIAAAPKRSKTLPYVYSITIEGNAFSIRVPVKIPNSVEGRAAFEKKYGKLTLPAGAGLEQLRAAAVRRLIRAGDCIVYNPGAITRKNALQTETVQTWLRAGSKVTSVGPKPKQTFGG